MDMSELASKMLAWESLKKEADALEAEICAATLAYGKTVVVGNVRATYSQPRKKYDYESAAKTLPAEILERYTETVRVVNSRTACLDHKLDVPFELQGEPSVRLKVK